jgi:hypothetical protein
MKSMDNIKNSNKGGARPGAGRPANSRKIMVGVRLSPEVYEKLNRLTKNKAKYIEELIKQQPE